MGTLPRFSTHLTIPLEEEIINSNELLNAAVELSKRRTNRCRINFDKFR